MFSFLGFLFKLIGISLVTLLGIFVLLILLNPQEKAQKRQQEQYAQSVFPEGQCSMITMYSATWCGSCKILHRELKAANAVFTEHFVDIDPMKKAELLQKLKGTGLRLAYPTVEVKRKLYIYPSVSLMFKLSC